MSWICPCPFWSALILSCSARITSPSAAPNVLGRGTQQDVDWSHKFSHLSSGWGLIDFPGGAELLELTIEQEADLIGHKKGFLQIVSDADDGQVPFLLQIPQESRCPHLEVLVQIGEGLIEEENRWTQDQRPGDSHPLLSLPPLSLAG
jgi:hypothetical protein